MEKGMSLILILIIAIAASCGLYFLIEVPLIWSIMAGALLSLSGVIMLFKE